MRVTYTIPRDGTRRRKENERIEPRIISDFPIWRGNTKNRDGTRGGPAREKENYRIPIFMETKVKKKRFKVEIHHGECSSYYCNIFGW